MALTRSENLPGFCKRVTLDDARTAQEVCTTVTSMFIEENLRRRQQQSEDTTQFLSQQLTDAKSKLDEQDTKLAGFKSHYIGSLPEQEQANLNLLNGLTTQLDATSQAIARAQQDKTFTQSMLGQQVAEFQSAQTGQSPDTIQKQLADLQTELTSLRARYTDDYPDVIKTKADIAALEKKIAAGNAPKAEQDDENSDKGAEEFSGAHANYATARADTRPTIKMIAEKGKEQDQIEATNKNLSGPDSVEPDRGGAVQGIDPRLSNRSGLV